MFFNEKKINKIQKENEKLLDEFKVWLKRKGLSEKTINEHINNVSFYINEYLLRYELLKAKKGVANISYFLGFWFIRKAMWSTEYNIKRNIAGLKKFYTFMYEKGDVTKKELDSMMETIKMEKEEWLDDVKEYNNFL